LYRLPVGGSESVRAATSARRRGAGRQAPLCAAECAKLFSARRRAMLRTPL